MRIRFGVFRCGVYVRGGYDLTRSSKNFRASQSGGSEEEADIPMDSVPLTDTHVHVWDVDRFQYNWLSDFALLNQTYDLGDYAEATAGVDVEDIVFVECTESFDDEVSREEVRWVESLAQKEEQISGIVAHASLENGGEVRSHLEWLDDRPLVTGIRRIVQDEDEGFMLESDLVEGLRMLPDYDFTFDLTIRSAQLPNTIALVDLCPEVDFVLDHIGKPQIREEEWTSWQTFIGVLARRENVTCKLSGVLTEADLDNWTYDEVVPYLEHVVECFGIDRLLFGGDWPVLRLAADYREWVEVLTRFTSDWSDGEKKQLFQGNADRVYNVSNAP